MKIEIPVLKKSFCMPLQPFGLLVFGYIKLIVACLMMIIYLLLLLRLRAKDIILVFISLVIIDGLTIAMLLTGSHKKNVAYFSWYYPYLICLLVMKIIALFMLLFFKPVLVIIYIPELALHAYQIILIRSDMKIRENYEAHCEFVNQMTGPVCTVKVEDHVSQDKVEKNSVYDIKEEENNHVKEENEKNNVNENGTIENNTNPLDTKMDKENVSKMLEPIESYL